jgi:hypothetical protein
LAAVRQREPVSFCVTCDAGPGDCEHTGHRYHDSWFELRRDGHLSPEYQAWFDGNPFSAEERSAPKPRPLPALEADIDQRMYLDTALRSQLRDRYDENPRKTSFMVQDVLRAFDEGRLMRPAGTLATRLKNFR